MLSSTSRTLSRAQRPLFGLSSAILGLSLGACIGELPPGAQGEGLVFEPHTTDAAEAVFDLDSGAPVADRGGVAQDAAGRSPDPEEWPEEPEDLGPPDERICEQLAHFALECGHAQGLCPHWEGYSEEELDGLYGRLHALCADDGLLNFRLSRAGGRCLVVLGAFSQSWADFMGLCGERYEFGPGEEEPQLGEEGTPDGGQGQDPEPVFLDASLVNLPDAKAPQDAAPPPQPPDAAPPLQQVDAGPPQLLVPDCQGVAQRRGITARIMGVEGTQQCFWVRQGEYTRAQAQAACVEKGGALAVLNSGAKRLVAHSQVSHYDKKRRIWVRATRPVQHANGWQWTNESPLQTNDTIWAQDKPDDGRGNSNIPQHGQPNHQCRTCSAINKNARLVDRFCEDRGHALCQILADQ